MQKITRHDILLNLSIYFILLQVLWGSIALLPDDMEALLYFFKFGHLLLASAKQEGESFKVFKDRKLWDSLKVSPFSLY
jgi:hypothetical protein